MSTITQLFLYPVKSCAGIALHDATLTAAGLSSAGIFDREWMVVDGDGLFLTQRHYPHMATVKPQHTQHALRLRAPGMADIDLPLARDEDGPTVSVKIWDDIVQATDCGDLAAAWFTTLLGRVSRLVRFHPQARRIASKQWTASMDAPTRFADGFPILVIGEASLADLNDKLRSQGRATLPMNRFRPNIVIDGIGPFEEDYAASINIGRAQLKPVKPCPRCPMPSVDQDSGIVGPDPLDILQSYRANPLLDGAITFGMNAMVMEGDGQMLSVGQACEMNLAF